MAKTGLGKFAGGGMTMADEMPYFVRSEEHNLIDSRAGGFLNSNIGGRTDRIPASVAADSYVVPADVISGLGQGNSLAGANILNQALRTGPFGTNVNHASGHLSAPHAPAMPETAAKGGHTGGTMPIIVAGGEHIVPPEAIERLGRNKLRQDKGDKYIASREEALKAGHRCMDELVKRVRAHTVKTIKNLPAPKR